MARWRSRSSNSGRRILYSPNGRLDLFLDLFLQARLLGLRLLTIDGEVYVATLGADARRFPDGQHRAYSQTSVSSAVDQLPIDVSSAPGDGSGLPSPGDGTGLPAIAMSRNLALAIELVEQGADALEGLKEPVWI